MGLKTLLIGVVFAMGIFALKSGVGLHYLLARKGGRGRKCGFFTLYALVYLVLFFVSAEVVGKIDLLAHFDKVQQWLQSGMLLHVIMAAGLGVWGIALLKGKDRIADHGSHGWLALVVPCPVCLTVVFMSTAFMMSYFPDAGYLAVLWAYTVFMGIVLITVLAMTLWGVRSSGSPEADMGAAMVIIAVYFFLSVIIMPQFGDLKEIYRIAGYQGDRQITDMQPVYYAVGITVLLFSAGFAAAFRKAKRRTRWI